MDRTTPPREEQIAAALSKIAHPGSEPLRALHLALPVSAVVGIDAAAGRDAWRFRGVTVPAPDARSAPSRAAELVALTHRRGDLYLDLDAAPTAWSKPLVSGSRLVAFGAELVTPSAPLVADASLDADDVAAFLVAAAGLDIRPPTVVGTARGSFVVDGSEGVWHLCSLEPGAGSDPSRLPPPVGIDEIAESLRQATKATSVEVVELPSRFPGALEAEVLLELGDHWQAIVPVTVAPGSELLGVPAGDTVPEPPAGPSWPLGFRVVGRSRWEDAAVAVHVTGVTCLLRQRT